MGMNLTPGLWQGTSASTQDNTSPHLWDLKLFVEISVPLVLTTIILPAVLGPSGLRNAIARAKQRWFNLLPPIVCFSLVLVAGISIGDSSSLWLWILFASAFLIPVVRLLFYN